MATEDSTCGIYVMLNFYRRNKNIDSERH